jgi:hypothetical protein
MWESGQIQVQDQLPMWTQKYAFNVIEKIWNDYGETIVRVSKKYDIPYSYLVGIIYIESAGNPNAHSDCNQAVCPGLWRQGLCADQGGPEKYCAGGLTAFISQTARQFGKTMTYFVEHPHEMIEATANLLVVGGPSGRNFGGGIRGQNGDVLSVIKQYNGGSKCSGGGITGHGGQSDYVTKFIRTCNAFVKMELAEPEPKPPEPYEPVNVERPQARSSLTSAAIVGAVAGLTYFAATNLKQIKKVIP